MNYSSKCYHILSFSTSHNVIYRERYNKLMNTHSLLMATYADSQARKRSHMEDRVPAPATRTGVMPDGLHKGEESHTAASSVYSRSDYPNINYWTKEEWNNFESKKKDSIDPTDKSGHQGRTRCAQGENVSTKYIEDEDRSPIGGAEAVQIGCHTRSLWIDFYKRQMASQK